MQLLANTTSPFVRIVRIAMIERGLDPEVVIVDPWADDARLRAANAAARVPTLVLDDGTALSECLLILRWIETSRPPPQYPSILGTPDTATGILARAGIALGAIEASTITIITRKVTAPVRFDDTPVGLRRRRTMVECMEQLETILTDRAQRFRADGKGPEHPGWAEELAAASPTLDLICAVVLFDYQVFRHGKQPWLPHTPHLKELAATLNSRPSLARTQPC